MEKMFSNSFQCELIKEKEEKYLYDKLYDVTQIEDCNVKRILELIEERAIYYSAWSLWLLLSNLGNTQSFTFLKKEELSSYSNILKVLGNKDDPNYNEHYIEKFKGYFVR